MGSTQARIEQFEAYVAARRGYLRRTAYLLCGDWHRAEDLTQNALERLFVAWPRIRQEGSEDAYARQTVVRAFLDERRRPWRRETPGLEGFDVAAAQGLAHEDVDALIGALRELPTRQRATVVLRYWCDLSVEETADELGCSPGTVKSQTSRAVATLRSALSYDPADDAAPRDAAAG